GEQARQCCSPCARAENCHPCHASAPLLCAIQRICRPVYSDRLARHVTPRYLRLRTVGAFCPITPGYPSSETVARRRVACYAVAALAPFPGLRRIARVRADNRSYRVFRVRGVARVSTGRSWGLYAATRL